MACVRLAGKVLEQRKREAGSLAGARLRGGEKISAGENDGNCF
jgi:hypothetical protein